MTDGRNGKPLRARIVLHPDNRGWILEKFAVRLAENLPNWNVIADIDDRPSPNADINHWMLFLHCEGTRYPKSTALVTHFTHPSEVRKLRVCLGVVDVGICLSRTTIEELVGRGIKREKLCYITPAHDGLVSRRRIVIGITSRVYADGRKREDLLLRIAAVMRLDAFHFEIIGAGWDLIIPHLEAAGATVRYHPGSGDYAKDYEVTLKLIPTFDYYLYTGWDEGSMGFLDALAAGVATIVTPQGFHLDVEGGITHAFENAAQLRGILEKISGEHQCRIDSVKDLTWNEYARQHAVVWEALSERPLGNLGSSPLGAKNRNTGSLPKKSSWDRLLTDMRFYGRPVLNRFRRLVKMR